MWGKSDVVRWVILYHSCSQFSGILWRPREQGRKCFIPISKRSLCCGWQFSGMVTRKIPTLWTVTGCGENSVVITVTLQYVYRGGRVKLIFIFSYGIFTPSCGTNKGDLISSNAWQRAALKAAVFYFLKSSVSLMVKCSLSPTLPLCGSPMTWWNFRG